MWRDCDIPFSPQDSYAALPWVMAFMVFLVILSLSMALNLHDLTSRWSEMKEHRVTLFLSAADDQGAAHAEKIRIELSKLDGVNQVQVVPARTLRQWLSPWLGNKQEVISNLPTPTLFDVVIDPAQTDTARFVERVSQQLPMLAAEDHAIWLQRFQRLVEGMQWVAGAMVLLILSITGIILAMSTRTEMALHQPTLELLRMLGADKPYIIQQFQLNALAMSLRGVAVGSVCGVAVLFLFSHLGGAIDAPLLPLMQVAWQHWVMIALVAVGCLGLTVFMARLTISYRLQLLNRL